MAKQRIMLADDHAVLRAGIRTLLDLEADMEVIGEAEDGLQAIAQANKLQPDLALIDLSMPLMNGTDAIRQIKLRNPDLKVIVMTLHKSDEHVRAALDALARGVASVRIVDLAGLRGNRGTVFSESVGQ